MAKQKSERGTCGKFSFIHVDTLERRGLNADLEKFQKKNLRQISDSDDKKIIEDNLIDLEKKIITTEVAARRRPVESF
jgi:hypothetical protein